MRYLYRVYKKLDEKSEERNIMLLRFVILKQIFSQLSSLLDLFAGKDDSFNFNDWN